MQGGSPAVLVIPPDFTRDLAAGAAAPVQLLLDGSDANTATIALNYADAIVARWSRRRGAAGAGAAAAGHSGAAGLVQSRRWRAAT